MTPEEWQAQIDAQALQPLEAANEQGTIKNRSLSELQDAKDRSAGAAAAANPRRGLRLGRLSFPGMQE